MNSAALILTQLPRPVKVSLVVCLDLALCAMTVWIALSIRFERPFLLDAADATIMQWPLLAAVSLSIPIFWANGLYRNIFRYAGWNAMFVVVRALLLYGVAFAFIFVVVSHPLVPRSVGISQPLMLLVGVISSRAIARYWLGGAYRTRFGIQPAKGVLIYGAGAAGRQLAINLGNHIQFRFSGFLDDSRALINKSINGWPVFNPDHLTDIVRRHDISEVWLALPSIGRQRRQQIIDRVRGFGLRVRTLPALSDLVEGKVSINHVRDLDLHDLLGRSPVTPQHNLLRQNIADKIILVTGAGGSIGSELSRQIIGLGPRRLILLDVSEAALHQIEVELRQRLGSLQSVSKEIDLIALLGSVTDRDCVRQVMSMFRPDVVYHAAAYKHVPIVETNVIEGVRNNVLGTHICAEEASRSGAQLFVLISTDKAVRPTNVMGASKRVAELALQRLAAAQEHTRFAMVRFGNVLGSSGSVVPLFLKQIRDGGPVTVTHPNVTRFFMTVNEASQLVIQAGSMATRSEVFMLDMGEPVKIFDLAQRMIELSGFRVGRPVHADGDIDIEFIGLRAGEKLHEELLIAEASKATAHPRIVCAAESPPAWEGFDEAWHSLQTALSRRDELATQQVLSRWVEGYRPGMTLESSGSA